MDFKKAFCKLTPAIALCSKTLYNCPMNTKNYLQRIGFLDENPAPTAETLRAIHLAHLYTVPFENLDISLGRPIMLDLEHIYHKIVQQRRGGFCYELNGLFGWLLQELGYSVTLLSASSFNDDQSHSPEYDHLALLVMCPGDETRWLVDVGWGSGFEAPLRLEHTFAQETLRFLWRIKHTGEYYSLWQKTETGDWIPHYRFKLTPHSYDEFAGMCHHHQTSPASIFTQKKLCTIFMPNKRVTLSDSKLIISENGTKKELDVPEDQIPEILAQYFGVVL
jgi:N-hydroxyarylamine O-acetyltransferase